MLVNHFLEESARRHPDKIALVCDDRRITYTQVDEESNRVANGLLEKGVQRGDRVAVWLPNSVDTVIAIFGILKAGATFTVINSTTKADKLVRVLNNCAARAIFSPGRRAGKTTDLFDSVPSLVVGVLCGKGASDGAASCADLVDINHLKEDCSPIAPPSRALEVDLACLIYTSGSTGDPKGVMSTHANMVFAASSIIEYLENTADDIVINVLPLSFDYGLYQLLMVMKFGGTLVLEKGFAFPAAVMKKIEQEKVTGLPGVPTVFAMLLQMDLDKFDLSSLRYLTNTAAALPVEHIQQLRDAFPWARLYSMYGLTECKRTLYLPPEELDRRPGSVGIAIPGTEVWIEDDEGNRLGPGQVGELVIRGGHVMQGYWNNPEATARWYRQGAYPADRRLYSGDLFRMDQEGFFFFVARKDNIIKSRGEKVAPKEVEGVLYKLPGVVEVAVVGVPDGLLGQAIKAVIACGDPPTLSKRDVLRHCTKHLEDYMIPKHVEFRDSLPKTASGKVDKLALS